jgi:hypothetical protein
MEAHAVTCTPYPLPLAQMTNLVTYVFAMLLAPIQFAATIENPFWSSGLNFFCTLLFFGVSECARELEDPFVGAPNDLPLAFLHAELNLGLIDLIKEPWPHRQMHGDVPDSKMLPKRTTSETRLEPQESENRHPGATHCGTLRRSLTIADHVLVDSGDSDQEQNDQETEPPGRKEDSALVSLPGAVNADSDSHDGVAAALGHPVAWEQTSNSLGGLEVEEYLPPGVPLTLPPPVRARYQRLAFRQVAMAVEISNHLANDVIADRGGS